MRPFLTALMLLLVWHEAGVRISSASGSEGMQPSREVLHRGRDVYESNCAICHGENGDGDGLDSQEIWALVYYLESLVPLDHRLSPRRYLGEEQQGWMVVRLHGMMGPGMMRRMPQMPMMP